MMFSNNFIPDFSQSLPKEFFLQKTEKVAKELLGKVIVKKIDNKIILAGKIVETEAYLSKNDLASHSAPGKTKRNAAMFSVGGILYVYKIYGIHHCINIVTEPESIGSAVLIRAIEPLLGIDTMKELRGNDNIYNLCSGPAKLAQAFDFKIKDNSSSLLTPKLFIQRYENIPQNLIVTSRRVGIVKSFELPLRFFINDSKFLSVKNNSKYL
ncbi:MAG: DNA-3-methyladenine glycosylase [FCB group bacterium]|jgi:DNA-3-methyladenine glycosylase